ncbi:MAG: hypothetical protein ACI4JF_04825, partial [Oscillospiraceae bacterium]
MQYIITPLLEVLNPTNTVSRNRLLSFAIGNVEAEIYNCLIAKHVYYNNQGKLHEGGWFYSTVMDLHLSSGYAEDAQKTAIRHLIKHGLIESELKGLPAKRYFRIIPDVDKLTSLIDSGEQIQDAIAQRYKDDLEKRSKRRKNKKKRIIEITAEETSPEAVKETATDSAQSVEAARNGDYGDSSPVSDRDSYNNSTEENISKAVANLHLSASVDDSDSVRVIGNSGDICSDTDFCAQNSCSAEYGGTRSTETPRETKDNKNQSDFFIDPSFHHSTREENFLADGIEEPTANKKLSFLEVLAELGLDLEDWHYTYTRDPTSEKDLLCVDEVDRRTKTLQIPESLRSDRNAVMTALRFLAAYGNYAYDDDMKPTDIKPFMDITLKMLCELIMSDSFTHNGRIVGYEEVLETLNELLREDYLYEFILNFQQEWNRILREDSGKHIRNSTAYMKSCL